jgi:hypothetical protein
MPAASRGHVQYETFDWKKDTHQFEAGEPTLDLDG